MIKKILGILFIVLALLLLIKFSQSSEFISFSSDTNVLKNTEEVNTYLGYLNIPKIDLHLGFFDYDSPLNDVSKNIELIKTGINNTYLIAAHSGIGKIAYFNDLYLLEIGDKISLEFRDKTNNYQVTSIWREKKNGTVSIPNKEDLLILTTCDQIVKGYQLVIESILVSD